MKFDKLKVLKCNNCKAKTQHKLVYIGFESAIFECLNCHVKQLLD